MSVPSSRGGARYGFAVVWLIVTVSLAGWWLVFGLSQARELRRAAGQLERASHVERMLLWEGVVFIALLFGGGTALLLAIRDEQRRRREVQDFFTAFTHDLKTALASVRLQAEGLQEDGPANPGHAALERLVSDTVRLELQLDNSLYFAQSEAGLYFETIDVSALAARASLDWPALAVTVEPGMCAKGDARALLGVIRNLLQNAVLHGRATTVTISAERRRGRIGIRVADDGVGAPAGVLRALERPFERLSSSGGSGVGLFISRRLLLQMGGRLQLDPSPDKGFAIVIDLKEAAC